MTIALLLLAASGAATVEASPSNVRLRVHDADTCGADPCSDASRIDPSARIDGPLRLFVHAEDPLGMRRVRVEAHPTSEAKWYCVAEADVRDDGVSVDVAFTWDTRSWPAPESGSGCTHTLPHIHGSPTPNAAMEMRAVAINLVDDQDTGASPIFGFSLANPAAAPVWADDPSVAADARAVALSWVPGTEPDLIEYLISRQDSDGTIVERRIDATTPEQDRCSRLGDAAIRCSDRLPDDGGTYSYKIAALRPGGAQHCDGRTICVASAFGEVRSVEVAAVGGGAPAPTLTFIPPSASGSATPVASGSALTSATPSDDGTLTASPTAGGDGGSAAPLLLLVALLIAAVAIAFRMRHRRAPGDGPV